MLGLLARRSLKAGGLIVELEEIGIRRSLTSSASSSGRHRLRPAAAASRRPPEPGTLPPAVQQQDDQVAAQQEQWEEVQHPSGRVQHPSGRRLKPLQCCQREVAVVPHPPTHTPHPASP